MIKFFSVTSVFMFSFIFPYEALAAVKIIDVSVKRTAAGVSIDVSLDRPFAARSLKMSFERNFIQLAMKAAKIDGARIQRVPDSEVQKVFAYPYASDMARVRVILRRDSQWARGRVSLWNNSPRSVRIFVKDPKVEAKAVDPALAQKAEAQKQPTQPRQETEAVTGASAPIAARAVDHSIAEEAKLLKEVESNTKDIDINNPDSVKEALKDPVKDLVKDSSNSIGITSDPSKHFARMAMGLLAVSGLFVGVAFLLKRYSGKLKKLPFGKKERLIQVAATHYLGGKKSISLVKVAGEYMVVGVSNDNISLISKLGAEVNVEKYMEDRFWGGTFEKHLDSYSKDKSIGKEIDLADGLSTPAVAYDPRRYDGPRNLGAQNQKEGFSNGAVDTAGSVMDRVELSPVRASIKEKLTKLKPLA